MELDRKSKIVRYCIYSMWAVLILSALVWVLVGSVAYWVKHGWLPPDSSGWAQAVGGLLAVVVAVGAPLYQNLHQQKVRDEEYASKAADGIYATLALAEHIKDLLDRMSALFEFSVSLKPNYALKLKSIRHDVTQAASMVREIPITSLTVLMVKYVVRLREMMSYAEHASNNISADLSWSPWGDDTKSGVRNNIHELAKIIEELELLLDDFT